MEYWVYLSSSAARRYYPESNGNDFIIPLHKPLDLHGEWSCALVQFSHTLQVPKTIRSYMVCTDVCKDSFVNDFSLPIIYRVNTGRSVKQPLRETYVKVKQGSVQSVRVYIRDTKGDTPSFRLGDVECTLHFVHHGSQYKR